MSDATTIHAGTALQVRVLCGRWRCVDRERRIIGPLRRSTSIGDVTCATCRRLVLTPRRAAPST